MAHYHGRNLTRSRRSPRRSPDGPPAYDPASPGYAERSAVYVRELGGGMVIEEVGKPIRRSPDEPQPVLQRSPKPAHTAPAAPPAPAPALDPGPSPEVAAKVRNHRALNRDP